MAEHLLHFVKRPPRSRHVGRWVVDVWRITRCLTNIRNARMLLSVEFIEAPFFTQVLPAYLGVEDYRELQLHACARS